MAANAWLERAHYQYKNFGLGDHKKLYDAYYDLNTLFTSTQSVPSGPTSPGG